MGRPSLRSGDVGFSLVEVIIAVFLVGLVAIALLPALWQGIRLSSQQSATATATRHLYALIEEARSAHDCTTLGVIAAGGTIPDGKGSDITITSVYDSSVCADDVAVPITLVATDTSGAQIARVDAKVFIQ